MFARPGEEWIIDADLMRLLEEYVCSLFSKGKKHLNMLRYEIFKNIYEKQGKFRICHFFHLAKTHFISEAIDAIMSQKYGSHALKQIFSLVI